MNNLADLGYSSIIVTGASGFVGSHIVRDLLSQGMEVTSLQRPPRDPSQVNGGNLPNHPNLRTIFHDVQDLRSEDQKVRDYDAIIHLAAITEIPLSLENPSLTFRVNHNGTLNLLEIARRSRRLKHFIVLSSEQVYSMPPKYLPIDENHPTEPSSVYGLSKLQQEQLARSYAGSYGVPVTVIRSSLLFGERQKDKGINLLIQKAIAGQPISIEGGEQKRDIYHVANLVSAINLALAHNPRGEVFNISGKCEMSVSDLVDRIIRFTRSQSEVKYTEYRKNEGPSTRMSLDISRAQTELGYNPVVTFEEGLTRTVHFLKSRDEHSGNISLKV